ncbi:MAG: MmcQ/YjbR family DNA-binding protein [Flavobacteriales bacterium]|nr:MmcQ/YjbR family DNA-binding protein [Flavobacteriales bacterium]
MNIEEFREYCIVKPGVTEETPFGPDTLVFKVEGKMFALAGMVDFKSINLKCDPEKALEYREEYHAVRPGYHMNKKHWNTVDVNMDVNDDLLKDMINHSFDLVVKSLPAAKRKIIQQEIASRS